MTSATAEMVLLVITGIGAMVWLAGLTFLLAGTRPKDRNDHLTGRLGEEAGEPASASQSGSMEVQGSPEALLAHAATLLAAGSVTGLGLVRIIERTERGLAFEGTGMAAGVRPQAPPSLRAVLRFQPSGGGRTIVEYRIGMPRRGGFLAGAWLCQILGLAALVTGFIIISRLVVTHPVPAVRTQAVQMVQAVHFLWPPFLLVALHRRQGRWVKNTLEALIHNLPYAGV